MIKDNKCNKTKEEFLFYVELNSACPTDFNLDDIGFCFEESEEECTRCWENAIKDIEFRADERERI